MVPRSNIAGVSLTLPDDWFDVDLEAAESSAWLEGLGLEFTELADQAALYRALDAIRSTFIEDAVDLAALYLPQPNGGVIGAAMSLDVFDLGEGDSPDSYLAFAESNRDLRSPELDVSGFQSWRSTHPSGELVGYSHIALVTPDPETGSSLEERAVFAIFPPDAAQMAQITFRTARLGVFTDIAAETGAIVDAMSFDLEQA